MLDERGRRRWWAAEARSHGRGGIAAVARVTGMSRRTIDRGLVELIASARVRSRLAAGRVRRPGAGARPLAGSIRVIEDLGAAASIRRRGAILSGRCGGRRRARRSSPRGCGSWGMSWSIARCCGCWLGAGYTMQQNARRARAPIIPIATRSFSTSTRPPPRRSRPSEPVISVDTKKKELVGEFKNGGREWAPIGQASRGQHARFPQPRQGQGDPVRGL